MSATDRAAGMLQGAGDTIQGTRHQARDWDRGGGESDREAAAQARWASGQPARNQYERDHFAKAEAEVTGGRMYLDRVAEQAMAA